VLPPRLRHRPEALDGTTVRFADFVAVQRTDLSIEAGAFFSFLGPSGRNHLPENHLGELPGHRGGPGDVLSDRLLTGAVLAFLQSFENFNTTVFAIGPDTTMTIQIASMVRLGLNPEVNALAVLFIAMTIAIAIAYELKRRAEKARQAIQAELAKRLDRAMATGTVGTASAAAAA
jgi:hypothetical protein